MALPVDEVLRIARLAHLRLDAAEAERMGTHLARILDYVAMLDDADVSSVEGTTHAIGLVCPLREDRVHPSLSSSEASRGAPHSEEDLFAVPRFVG